MDPQFFTYFCKIVGTVRTNMIGMNLTHIEIEPFSLGRC